MRNARNSYKILAPPPKKRKDYVGDKSVDRRMLLKLSFKEIVCLYEGAKWIHLTQDRVQWRTFVNMVMNP
jgi:hypothetical protein